MAVHAPQRAACMDFQLAHCLRSLRKDAYLQTSVQTVAKYENWESKTLNYTQAEQGLQPLVWEHAFPRGWL